jgi:hypothetical protein
MDTCTLLVSGVFAGRVHVHGLLDVRVHAAGVMLTVDSAGTPLTVKVTGRGKVVPLVGAMANE